MVRHLRACSEREKAIAEAGETSRRREKIYHIRAEDQWSSSFWLDLEVCGSATLEDVDQYLRAIWLECCGHLSMFSIGGWGGDELPMGWRVNKAFGPDTELTHIYDFGTSSHTILRTMDTRRGTPTTDYPIALMARNLEPEAPCIECGEPGSWLCLECAYEHDSPGFLCDGHVEEHPHDDYGEPTPLVNSPRVGMCGYYGPADPPY
jgi:hypothetical protein